MILKKAAKTTISRKLVYDDNCLMKKMQKYVQLWTECHTQCTGASFDFIFIYIKFDNIESLEKQAVFPLSVLVPQTALEETG